MKTTKRRRKERRLRILERDATRRRTREAGVAIDVRRERTRAHRGNLFGKCEAAKSDLGRTDGGPDRREKERKLSFFARLLGRN